MNHGTNPFEDGNVEINAETTKAQSSKRVNSPQRIVPEEEYEPMSEKSRLLPSKPEKTPVPAPSFKAGIGIMLFITFLSSVCFSIVLPSIWPYLQSMHQDKSTIGWAVAVNSAGSFIASPVFGMWSDRRGSREVVMASLIIMVIGNLMYSLAKDNFWILLAGRFIVGVAAANYAVAQTYLSYATTVDNRTRVMAMNSAATVLGFIIGPAFALGMTFADVSIDGIEINDYTLPGYLSAVMSIGSMFSLIWLKEIPSSFKKGKKQVAPTGGSSKSALGSGFYSGQGSMKDISSILKMSRSEVKIPWFAVVLCLFAYFSYTTSFTVFETIGTPFTQAAFGWGVTKNSYMFIGLGGVCISSLFILQIFVRFFNDRILLVITSLLATAGFAALFDPRGGFAPLWRFWIGVSLCSASYSTSVAVLISVYSKVLEGLDQGMMMGWLSSSGSIARIVGPVVASYALEYGGASGRLVFILMMALTGITTLICLLGYRVLRPRTTSTSKPSV